MKEERVRHAAHSTKGVTVKYTYRYLDYNTNHWGVFYPDGRILATCTNEAHAIFITEALSSVSQIDFPPPTDGEGGTNA